MESAEFLLWIRGLERLLIVGGAFFVMWLGVLLYKWGTDGTASLVVKKEKYEFQFLNATPGLFCFLFGTGILFLAECRGIDYTVEKDPNGGKGHTGATNQATSPQGGQQTTVEKFHVTYNAEEASKLKQLLRLLKTKSKDDLIKTNNGELIESLQIWAKDIPEPSN